VVDSPDGYVGAYLLGMPSSGYWT